MAKPHVRLKRLIDCPDGTRFYTFKTCNPYTLITSSAKKKTVWVHLGHNFNIHAVRKPWLDTARGWVLV